MRRVVSGLLLVLCWADLSAAGQQRFVGRRLEDALRILQQAGVPIVFSSEVVRPDMRVLVEPRAASLRQQLDELLSPHGLKAQPAPGQKIIIVPDRSSPRERSPQSTAVNSAPADRRAISPRVSAIDRYSDEVTVWGVGEKPIQAGSSEATLGQDGVRAASSVLAGDGLEAVRTMPRVVATDDFRSEFSIRGNGYRQTGIVIDGVATPWLQHAVYGRSDAGSLSMFTSDIVDRVAVQAGPYARQYGDVLGGQVDVALKEGSRDANHFAARAGGTSAVFDGEGPIGQGRGSWAAGVRDSYRSWPPLRLSERDVGFGFADAHAKVVYDVSATQQISVTALAGRSTPETVDEPLVGPIGSGVDRAALVSVGWRSILGSRSVLRQRAFFVGQDLETSLPTGALAGRSSNRALGYRGELIHSVLGGLLSEGAEVSAIAGARDVEVTDAFQVAGAFHANWATQAVYANFSRDVSTVRIEAGARVSHSTLVQHHALSPWLHARWRLSPSWTLNAAAGASRQFADLEAARGPEGTPNLSPERATLVDVALEQRLPHVRWQATLFNRKEYDLFGQPRWQLGHVDERRLDAPLDDHFQNALSGSARGLELVVIPDHIAGFSGWLSYSYAMARQTDHTTGETFWSDFDRRHAVNLAATFRLGRQSSVGAVLRGASGIPIPGYFEMEDGALVPGNRRNTARLPVYLRLDSRAQHTFFPTGHAVTFFGEVLNVLNRSNEGLAAGAFQQPFVGEVAGFSRTLMPRRLSIGIELNLSR
jgi:hypothetical protein